MHILKTRGRHLVGERQDGVDVGTEGAQARAEVAGVVAQGVGGGGGERAVV